MKNPLTLASLVVVVLIAMIGAVSAQASNFVWEAIPTTEDVEQAYPPSAIARGIEGNVMLQCFVRIDRTLLCEVEIETPTGNGFGDAALRLSTKYRIAAQMADGRATVGGRLHLPVIFKLAD